MKKYKFSFYGRQTGAIGIFYNISHTYEAENLSEAKTMFYTDYEGIRDLKVTENGKHIDFNSAPFSNKKYSVSLNRK